VDEQTQVGEVRRAADALAARAGLGERARTLALVATEIATNLARHAQERPRAPGAGGRGAGRRRAAARRRRRAGIRNVGRAMEDGYSTAGTAGQGLGAIRRMAHEFDLYSRTDGAAGTVLLARVWSAAGARASAAAPTSMQVGAVCVPLRGEQTCGDAWTVLHQRDRTLAVVVDGLGHGPEAALASSEAIRMVRAMQDASPGQMVDAAHGALRATRGAAMAVAAIQPARGTVTFAGIGNISGGHPRRRHGAQPGLAQRHRGPHHAQGAGVRVRLERRRRARAALRRHQHALARGRVSGAAAAASRAARGRAVPRRGTRARRRHGAGWSGSDRSGGDVAGGTGTDRVGSRVVVRSR
jgi:anti-sigma regulatory factor (Ser/Thr protein kinase)